MIFIIFAKKQWHFFGKKSPFDDSKRNKSKFGKDPVLVLFFKGIPGSQLSICSCLSFFFGIDSTNQNIYTVRNCIKHNQSTDQRPRRAKKAHLIPNRNKKPDQRFAADSVTWICSLFIRKHVETILNEFHEIKGKPVVN